MEPGFPHFDIYRKGPYRKHEEFKGASLTTAGNWRIFPCIREAPHEPWCLHFEWGPCSCGPEEGEVFVKTGTTDPPKPRFKLLRRLW